MARTVYLIQGLAQKTAHWKKVQRHLPADVSTTLVDMLTLGFEGDHFSLERAVLELDELIQESDAVVCGLSSGAVIGLKHAAMFSAGRTHRYVLAAPQIAPGRWPGKLLLGSNRLIYRYMKLRTGRDLKREKVRSVLETYATLDLRDELPAITSPVLVLIGRLDPVHRRPTAELARLVPQSERVKLTTGSHESNRTSPRQFAEHLTRVARSS